MSKLPSALITGIVLAVGAIGLFWVLYSTVFAGQEPAIRLFASMLIPPVVLGLLVGGYYLLTSDEEDV